jgi:PPOX class probable F420-dependent enzyme
MPTNGELTPQERNAFLSRPIIARIATVSPDQHPHVVPVWYLWDGTSLWISSYRSSRKMRDLQANPACSVVIDEAESGVDYQAVLMEGQVEVIDQPADAVKEKFTEIYSHYLGPAGVLAPDPQEWINDPDNALIKLTPEKIKTWYSRSEEIV